MKPIPLLQLPAPVPWLENTRADFQAGYYAMYSSVLGGIVTDPVLMSVPVDDHLVHRGDGVFETIKCVGGGIYGLHAHMRRLLDSARAIGLSLPWDQTALSDIIAQTVRAGRQRDCLIRVLLSRGPGSLGVNPYDCPTPGLYVIVHELKPSFMESHPGGARVISSKVPVKPSFFANIKTCNYLPNVLMKKEAVDAGVDFSLAFDEHGGLAEGATENAGIVTASKHLRIPRPDHILPGTTMLRCMELARRLIPQGLVAGISSGNISRADLRAAAELLIFGTTPDVTAVVELDGRPVGDGKPGPVFRALSALLADDIRNGKDFHTPVFM